MSPATETKRRQLTQAIETLLAPHDCILGVVAVGSVATNTAREDSDIDALVFMSPLDRYIVPAESLWRPSDNTFHSIFDETVANAGAIPLDLVLVDFARCQNDEEFWSDEQKAGLAEGWIAYDPSGEVARTVSARTRYDDAVRISKIDIAVTSIDQILAEGTPERVWHHLGPLRAFDRLLAAYGSTIDLIFALNRRWRFWPERQMTYLLSLPRLPADCEKRLERAITGARSLAGYQERVQTLRGLFRDVLDDLCDEGFYQGNPISEAFIRSHDQPGRSWNIAEWNEKRRHR